MIIRKIVFPYFCFITLFFSGAYCRCSNRMSFQCGQDTSASHSADGLWRKQNSLSCQGAQALHLRQPTEIRPPLSVLQLQQLQPYQPDGAHSCTYWGETVQVQHMLIPVHAEAVPQDPHASAHGRDTILVLFVRRHLQVEASVAEAYGNAALSKRSLSDRSVCSCIKCKCWGEFKCDA